MSALRSSLSSLQEHYSIQMPERKASTLFDLTSSSRASRTQRQEKNCRNLIQLDFFPLCV